ncbi:MAG: hypothetical protein ACRDFC_00485, partial [Ignavibacteria bacterium]
MLNNPSNSMSGKKKPILILVIVLIFNLIFTISLLAGLKILTEQTKENAMEIVDLSRKQFYYFFQKFFYEYIDQTNKSEQRKEDSTIVTHQNLYDANHYDLSLSFDIPNKSIEGELIMKATSLSDTLKIIYLNFYDNMNVSKIKFTNTPEQIENASDVDFKRGSDYVIIDLKQNLKKDQEFSLKISYSGKPKSIGFDSFTFKDIHGNPTVYNLSEPTYGPTWWPSKDLPNDKALSNMHLRVPTGFKGVSNGLLIDTVQNGDGTTTFSWKNSYPIATYLVSIIVAKFAYWEDTYTSVDGSK